MKIEIWSDVVCPWCYIGKRRFEAALEGLDEAVEVRWRSFELDPGALPTPEGSLAEELASKYRLTVEEAERMMDQMAQAARGEGLEFDFASARRGNTLDAHRLLHFASDRGVQGEMKERLLRAYFSEGRAIADRGELAALAADAGLDQDEVEAMLSGSDYVDAVRRDEARAGELGIGGVPFFLIQGRLGISGAQPVELMRQGLERARTQLE